MLQGHGKELDDSEIAKRYQKIMDIYSRGKISQKNAWRLKLLENIDRMLTLEAAGNYKKASATIAAAAQIYRYRVDDVYKHTCKMMSNIIGGSTLPIGEKKRKIGNLKTVISSQACSMDPRQVLAEIDPLFHKTTTAFDEGGSRGLLMNNLSVHNGCDTILDSTTVIMKRKRKTKDSKVLDEASLESKEDFDAEDPEWRAKLNEQYKPLQYQEKDICPVLKHIIKKIEKVKQTPEARSRSEHASKSNEFASMDFFEEDEPEDYEGLDNVNEIAALGDYEAGSYESLEGDELVDIVDGSLIHPSLLKNWTGPEQWIRRRQLFRRRFKHLQKAHAEKKNQKTKEPVGGQIKFEQAANGVLIPEEFFAAPIRPLATKLTEGCLLKLTNDLHLFPEDLQVDSKLLTQLFIKPKLYVSTHGVIKQKETTPLELPNLEDMKMDINIENDFNMHSPYEDFELSSPREQIASPTMRISGDERLQLVNDRDEADQILMEVAKISKKINIKQLKDCIWRHIYRHCLRGTRKQPVERSELLMADRDVRIHPVATSFRSAMTYISNYYDKIEPRSKDLLSVPFVFMALLHLANVKTLRFAPMKDTKYGRNFKIMVDESTNTN